jgi:hypothetical protein
LLEILLLEIFGLEVSRGPDINLVLGMKSFIGLIFTYLVDASPEGGYFKMML